MRQTAQASFFNEESMPADEYCERDFSFPDSREHVITNKMIVTNDLIGMLNLDFFKNDLFSLFANDQIIKAFEYLIFRRDKKGFNN